MKGEFVLDSSRVKRGYVRGLGRFATFIAGQVEASQSEVQVHLPEYGDVLVGTASIPPFKVGVRDGRVTHVDFLSDLTVGDAAGMRSIAIDWLEGRMGRLQLNGIATTHLRSGLLNLGAVTLSETRAFEGWLRSPSSARLGTNSAFSFLIAGKDLPALPEFNMTRAIAYDGQDGSVGIDVCINALFDFPLTFTVPPLGFEVLVPDHTRLWRRTDSSSIFQMSWSLLALARNPPRWIFSFSIISTDSPLQSMSVELILHLPIHRRGLRTCSRVSPYRYQLLATR